MEGRWLPRRAWEQQRSQRVVQHHAQNRHLGEGSLLLPLLLARPLQTLWHWRGQQHRVQHHRPGAGSLLQLLLARPLWLLPEPRPIARPAPENILAGPERIESGWWDGSDGEISRDYFVASRQDHSLVWVFRESRPPHGWFLHGYFS